MNFVLFWTAVQNFENVTLNSYMVSIDGILFLLQIRHVDAFVNSVNTTLKQKQDMERLKAVIARIEAYDVVVKYE